MGATCLPSSGRAHTWANSRIHFLYSMLEISVNLCLGVRGHKSALARRAVCPLLAGRQA